MSGGKLVFGAGIGYRDVEFKAFGVPRGRLGARFEECLLAIRRVDRRLRRHEGADSSSTTPPARSSRCKSQPRRSGSAPMPISRSAARPVSAIAGTSIRTTRWRRSSARWTSTSARSRSPADHSRPRCRCGERFRRRVPGRGDPPRAALPGRKVQGLPGLGAGQGDAQGRRFRSGFDELPEDRFLLGRPRTSPISSIGSTGGSGVNHSSPRSIGPACRTASRWSNCIRLAEQVRPLARLLTAAGQGWHPLPDPFAGRGNQLAPITTHSGSPPCGVQA